MNSKAVDSIPELEELERGRPWFRFEDVAEGVIRIIEPYVNDFMQANMWLLRGARRDLLIYTGNGIASLHGAIEDMKPRNLLVIATHAHADHVGSLHEGSVRENVNVAVIQDAATAFDKKATLERVERLLEDSSDSNPDLVLFPEAFVPGFPSGLDWGGPGTGVRADAGQFDYVRYVESAIAVPGPETGLLGKLAKQHDVNLVIGVIEKIGSTLSCSILHFARAGELIHVRRKVMPTMAERTIWGQSDGASPYNLGLVTGFLPEEYGGLGLSNVDSMIIIEEIAAVDAGFDATVGVNALALMPLLTFGIAEQKQGFLTEATSDPTGEFISGYAISELDGTANFDHPGAMPSGLRLTAIHDKGSSEFVLNGSKYWPSNCGGWDLMGANLNVVAVRTSPSEGATGAFPLP